MQDNEAIAIAAPPCTLGESVLWDHRRNALWWVDVRSPCVHRLDHATGEVASFRMPEVVAALALRRGGGMLACLRSGIWALDPDTGTVASFIVRDDGHAGNRMNDTKVDPHGRLWTSTMWDFARERTGAVYRVGSRRMLERVMGPFRIPNGICFAPDGKTMYFTDTAQGDLLAYPIDPDTGELGPSRLFAPASAAPGHPDGATVDAEGYVWSARFGAGAVARFAPDGRLDRIVSVPATQVASCGFGGPDLDVLFVATGTQGLPPEELRAQERAGALFALRLGVRGIPENEYIG